MILFIIWSIKFNFNIFSKLIYDLMCFKFLMCVSHSALCRLATSFSTFSISLFQVKLVNLCEVHLIFPDIEHQLQENILHHFLHYSFLWNLHQIEKYLRSTPNLFITTIWIIYISILTIWRFFIFTIIFNVFVISFCISINIVTYST